jgi:rhamnose transport system permease protein
MSAPVAPAQPRNWRAFFLRHEAVLLLLLVVEIFYFDSVGRRFGTVDNTFDIMRHSVEIGLLALVMTPIILTGGIDLSVGSLLGLCAVLFGKMWRDGGVPPWLAALCTIGFGAMAGRAEWQSRHVAPPAAADRDAWHLLALSRSGGGAHPRGGYLHQFSPQLSRARAGALARPARAGVDLRRDRCGDLGTGALHHLRALVARDRLLTGRRSVRWHSRRAADRLRLRPRRRNRGPRSGDLHRAAWQAKADAGTGYELFAITAVVLGGTSIFGGVGSVHGTLLGVAAIAVLGNGLVHARQPREVAGILTGVLLLVALASSALPQFLSAWRLRRQNRSTPAP